MAESSKMFIHRSSVVTMVSRHLSKTAIHDFDGSGIFPVVLTSVALDCGRLNSIWASNQTETRDMLENARLNLSGLYDLGQVRWRFL